MTIEASHISKSFGAQQVLKDVTFTIPEGQVLGLLGPNGAGKSTLMKILIGLWHADSGSVAVPPRIGYLPENNPLYEEMYVSEYLEFMCSLENPSRKDKKQIAHKVESLIEKVGLTPERHKHIRELSKGYRQRVGLAQALTGDPQLLILDEPTTGLDPNQLVDIRSLIRDLASYSDSSLTAPAVRTSRRSIILSTHIMQEVREMCDRVIILDHGSIRTDRLVKDVDDLEVLFREATGGTMDDK